MINQETKYTPKRRLQKKTGTSYLLSLILIVLFLVGGYFLFFSESAQRLRPVTDQPATQELLASGKTDGEKISTGLLNDTDPKNQDIRSDAESLVGNNPADLETGPASGHDSASSITGTASTNPSPLAGAPTGGPVLSEECTILADNVEQFFDRLDTREYMQKFDLVEKSSIYFPRLIQKLVDNPPVVSGETDDLFTILQNTAHFFRIIGKKNIFILKGILDREKETFEQTLSDFYQLTNHPDCLQERFGLTIAKEPLYKYAGFFINTMGGRLYLFRRDSMSRMVVSYYAIDIIDQANREGRNKYGIAINNSIDSLISEIESSSIKLQMRDRYLDMLYSLKMKYQ